MYIQRENDKVNVVKKNNWGIYIVQGLWEFFVLFSKFSISLKLFQNKKKKQFGSNVLFYLYFVYFLQIQFKMKCQRKGQVMKTTYYVIFLALLNVMEHKGQSGTCTCIKINVN